MGDLQRVTCGNAQRKPFAAARSGWFAVASPERRVDVDSVTLSQFSSDKIEMLFFQIAI